MLTKSSHQGCIPLGFECQGIVEKHHSLKLHIATHIYPEEHFCEAPQDHQNRHSLWQTLSLHPKCETNEIWLLEYPLGLITRKQCPIPTNRWIWRSTGIIVRSIHCMPYRTCTTRPQLIQASEYATMRLHSTWDQDDQPESHYIHDSVSWAPIWTTCSFLQ